MRTLRGSGPSSLPAPGQTTGGSAGLGRKQPLKHAFSVGQAPRQPPGDCRFTFLPKGCPSNAAFTLASALRRAAGPQGGSRYIQVWLRGLPAEFGGTREVPRARGGSLKNLFPRERGLSVCAPGNPRAVLSGFLPGRKTKQNEPRPHVRLPYLEKGPVFRARAGRRAIGLQIRSDRGQRGTENTPSSPCHSKGLGSQRRFSPRPHERRHAGIMQGSAGGVRQQPGPQPGALPGPGPRGSRHSSAPGQAGAPGPLRPARRA